MRRSPRIETSSSTSSRSSTRARWRTTSPATCRRIATPASAPTACRARTISSPRSTSTRRRTRTFAPPARTPARNVKVRAKEYYDLHPSLAELATSPSEIVRYSRGCGSSSSAATGAARASSAAACARSTCRGSSRGSRPRCRRARSAPFDASGRGGGRAGRDHGVLPRAARAAGRELPGQLPPARVSRRRRRAARDRRLRTWRTTRRRAICGRAPAR